jgi:two-component system, OmpR family, phosphate regulon response regulator OmpR
MVNNIKPRILVVDDDLRLRSMLKSYLGDQGFACDTAQDAAAMTQAMVRMRYDIVVLDVMMPGEDGFSACKRLRAAGELVPIIMLTAKDEDGDRITGLDIGADDYMGKPFNPQELVSRINAIMRRMAPLPTPGAPTESEVIVAFGDFVLNLGKRTLTRGGEIVPLTTGEFSMLRVFAEHQRVPLSRDKLAELARGRELETFDRSIDVQISRVRKLLEVDSTQPKYIQTVWGVGYVFIPD